MTIISGHRPMRADGPTGDPPTSAGSGVKRPKSTKTYQEIIADLRAAFSKGRDALVDMTGRLVQAEATCAAANKEAGELRAEVDQLARLVGYLERAVEDEVELSAPPVPRPRRYGGFAHKLDPGGYGERYADVDGYGHARPKPLFARR